MNTYTPKFYDLLSLALGSSDSYVLQSYLDNVMASKYNELSIPGFAWSENMSPDFTVEVLYKNVDIIPMAQYVDLDSPAVPIGTSGMGGYTAKIPRMKLSEYYNEDKMRKVMLAERKLNGLRNGANDVINAARNTLFVTTDTLIGAHVNSLSHQRHQMVSKGLLEINSVNNPMGVKDLRIEAKVPTKNVTTLKGNARWWTLLSDGTYSTPGSACDPVKNLRDMVRNAQLSGLRNMHFELEFNYADQVAAHPKVVEAVATELLVGAVNEDWAIAKVNYMTTEAKLATLGKIVGAPFQIMDHVSTVQKFNKDTQKLENKQLNAFEPGVIVLVPDGQIGEIVPVEPIVVNDPAATYGGFFDGRLLLTVTYDASKKAQAYETELTALSAPTMPQYMYYLYPYNVS